MVVVLTTEKQQEGVDFKSAESSYAVIIWIMEANDQVPEMLSSPQAVKTDNVILGVSRNRQEEGGCVTPKSSVPL